IVVLGNRQHFKPTFDRALSHGEHVIAAKGDVLWVMLGEKSTLLRTFGRSRDGKADLLSLNGLLVHETCGRRDKFRCRWLTPQHGCGQQSSFCRRTSPLCQGRMVQRVDRRSGGMCAADLFWLEAEFRSPGPAAPLMTGPAEIQP